MKPLETARTDLEPRMKVAVVLSVFQAWRRGYFQRLQARHSVDLTIFHGKGVAGTKLRNAPPTPEIRRVELEQISLQTKVTGRAVHAHIFRGLLRGLRDAAPEVVLLEGGSNLFNNILVLLWCRVKGVPVVWWTLGEIPGRRYTLIGRAFRLCVAFMERRCDALLLYSSVAESYARRIGIPPERCFVATNVVDTEACAVRAAPLRMQRGKIKQEILGGDGPVVIFVGTLAEGKSLDALPDLFARIVARVPAARLLVVGDGPLRGDLETAFGARQVKEAVVFAGEQREDLSRYMVCGDVFLLPGLGGLAISEAMAHGVPVVCSQGDGTEVDLVVNGETGCRYEGPPGEATSEFLVESAALLLNDAALQSRYSDNALQKVIRQYTGTRMVNQIYSALRHAHATGRSRASPFF